MGEHRDWDAVLEPRPSNPDEPRGRGTRPWTARRPQRRPWSWAGPRSGRGWGELQADDCLGKSIHLEQVRRGTEAERHGSELDRRGRPRIRTGMEET